jgi:hypothetical protein
MNTAPQIERREMAFVLRLKICDISIVLESRSPGAAGIYQIKEGPPVARRPFEKRRMPRYFAQQGGSPQQLPPHVAFEVAEATVPRAATRTSSSANKVFFMTFLLGALAPVFSGIRILLGIRKRRNDRRWSQSSQFRKVTLRR